MLSRRRDSNPRPLVPQTSALPLRYASMNRLLSGWRDSNPRPFGPEPNALPTALHPDDDEQVVKTETPEHHRLASFTIEITVLNQLVFAPGARLELATSPSSAERSTN